MSIASTQFSITDLNDPIISSATPPLPSDDTMWLDTSVEPNLLKRWDGLKWVVVNDVKDLRDSVNTLQTDFKVEQGKISSLIKDTTIINPDGTESKLKDKYNETVKTVDGINTSIGNIESGIGELESSMAEIKATADSVSSTVTTNKTKWDQAYTNANDANQMVKQTVKSIDNEFALSNSKTQFDKFTEWNKIPPSFVEGKFMWQRTKTTYVDSSAFPTEISNPICISGNKGDKGQDGDSGKTGNGIKSITMAYGKSNSSIEKPTVWESTLESLTLDQGDYLWIRYTIDYTDPNVDDTITYSYSRQGVNGENGVSITKVDVLYKQTNSSTPSPQTPSGTNLNGWETKAPSWINGKFIWSCTQTRLSNGTITYSEAVCVTGQNGHNGSNGQGVESIIEEYLLSTSKIKTPMDDDKNWSPTPPVWSVGKYIWTRSKITYKNPTSVSYTTPICSSEWEAVNNIQVGGRNLILGTNNGYFFNPASSTRKIENQSFSIGYNNDSDFNLVESLIPNQEYSISFKVRDIVNNISDFSIALSNQSDGIKDVYTQKINNDQVCLTFIPKPEQTKIKIYNGKVEYNNKNGCYIYNLQLEKGNRITDWRLAPEDYEKNINQSISKIEQKADKINLIVKSGTNESNLELTDGAIRATADKIDLKGKVTFSWLDSTVQNDINKPNSILDNLQKDPNISKETTTIHGGFIQANTIKINQLDVDNIFSSGTSVMNIIDAREINADRITSGHIKTEYLDLYGLSVTNKDTKKETLKIDPSGNVTIRGSFESYNYKKGENGWSIDSKGTAELNEVTVRGNVITANGGICNDNISSKEVRFWAGSSYEKRADAPFIVYSDGTVRSTKGLYGGIWTGDIKVGNISIVDPNDMQGNDAVFTIKNGQGTLKDRVRLTDTEDSFFNQNVHFGDFSNDKNISLMNNGTGYFKNGIRIGENISLNNTSLNFKNGSISEYEESLLWNGKKIQIGELNKRTNTETYGDYKVHGKVRIDEQLEFSDVVRMKLVNDGLNIDIVNELVLNDFPVDDSNTYINTVESGWDTLLQDVDDSLFVI